MKIKAAILKEMGLPMPYAESLPLKVEEINLESPGPGGVTSKNKSIRALSFRFVCY